MRESKQDSTEQLTIKMTLTGDNKEMFEDIKKRYNLKYNIEVFRLILKRVHDLEFNEV